MKWDETWFIMCSLWMCVDDVVTSTQKADYRKAGWDKFFLLFNITKNPKSTL